MLVLAWQLNVAQQSTDWALAQCDGGVPLVILGSWPQATEMCSRKQKQNQNLQITLVEGKVGERGSARRENRVSR